MGITHLGIHTGFTQKIRAQATRPTDPDPEHIDGVGLSAQDGDMYFDTVNNLLVFKTNSNWTGVIFS